MQRTTETDQMAEWTTQRIRAAQYGDPWASDQVLAAHRPLVHALVSRALDARPDASAADAVAGDTLRRARAALHTLPYPEAFRPWLVGLAVDTVLGHAALGPDGGGGWLDVQDAVLAALGSLEAEGLLRRYETAAALQWTPEDTAARMETVRARAEAARSVEAALARRPRCPGLQEVAAGWDGRPGAGWRDHLARHTLWCALCGSAASNGVAPTVVVPSAVVPSTVVAGSAAPAYGADTDTVADAFADAFPDAFAEEATRAYDLGGLAPAAPAAPAASDGRRATRGDRRRRRQAEERTRRRAAVAAGIAVVAVTGGAFSLYGGGRDGKELLETNRAAAPGPDTPLSHDPDSLSTTPAGLGASPSASATSPGRTTASATPGGGKKTATARPTTAAPTPQRTTAIPTPTLPRKTAAPTTAAPKPAPTTASPTPSTDPAPGGGAQNDDGQGSAADQVLSLVNAERAKAGCGPLTANATLARAAQAHSDDMAARDFFDHTNPDGADPGDRVTAAGYPWSTYGENIAMGQRTPEQVMEAWMNSPGHRANILNCDFKELGVGIHDDGGPYWTQVFGAR
ncbi:CAP domain-containing protein [Streptomyces sp. NPDC007863]|uniref:CAP domain-containing protein n=1 Tax=Streptomyces sp. NPDC007863 TaxID=3154894 RepID=UPI0033D95371